MSTAVKVLAIVMITITFEGLLFGSEIAARSFPSFDQPTSGGFFGALDAILAVLQAVWGAIVFFFNLLTFNIPGAPWWIRIPIGSILGGGFVWSIAALIRGGGGDS